MKQLQRRFVFAAALTVLAMPALSQAEAGAGGVASASAVSGPVKVNQGVQFQPLLVGQGLNAGDRVMALGGGSATITFKDGCTLEVEPETLVVVPALSTCAGGVVDAQSASPGSSQAVGGNAANPGQGGAAGNAGGYGDAGFAVAAGAVLLGGAIISATEGEKDTASP